MAKKLPDWLRDDVQAINIKLVNDEGMGWEDILATWGQLLKEMNEQ